MAVKLLHPTLPENLEAIGRVTVQWGVLEMTVDQAIPRFLQLDEKSSFKTLVGVPISLRLGILSNLTHLVENTTIRSELVELLLDIDNLRLERNFIVHAVWMGDGKTIYGYIFKNNKARVRQERWSATEIGAIADRINDASARLISCLLSSSHARRPEAPYSSAAQKPR